MKHIIGGTPPAAPGQVQTLTVDADSTGQRLDNFLMRQLKGVPKTHVYRIIRSGEVRINKGRADASTRIQAGDMVRLPPVRISQQAVGKAQAMAQPTRSQAGAAKSLPVLFEDEHMLVINKPAGLAVHGGSGISFGVIEQLRMARPQADFLELVHRLDRETSGILLVAKKRSALKNLQNQFRERSTGKTYLGMVGARWPLNRKVLDKPLQKFLLTGGGERSGEAGGDGEGERRVRVVAPDHPDAMPSLTLVKVRAASRDLAPGVRPYSLLEITIKTGRTHQIRVHLAAEGMPLVGDDKYGDFEHNKALARGAEGVPLKRMFLHAWRLQCRHPVSNAPMNLEAGLPGELMGFLQAQLPHALPASGGEPMPQPATSMDDSGESTNNVPL
ncbi:MAG: RluA family pseudouridine synthase [Betaproteobacteria bacterium]|nr:RluA family pseudouridine synthase [Betaproteobacteria bacterium]